MRRYPRCQGLYQRKAVIQQVRATWTIIARLETVKSQWRAVWRAVEKVARRATWRSSSNSSVIWPMKHCDYFLAQKYPNIFTNYSTCAPSARRGKFRWSTSSKSFSYAEWWTYVIWKDSSLILQRTRHCNPRLHAGRRFKIVIKIIVKSINDH